MLEYPWTHPPPPDHLDQNWRLKMRSPLMVLQLWTVLLWLTYFVGRPGLSVHPVHVVPDVPPLDLQRVWGCSCSSEGACHLHVLAPVCRHIVRDLREHSCTHNRMQTETLIVGFVSLRLTIVNYDCTFTNYHCIPNTSLFPYISKLQSLACNFSLACTLILVCMLNGQGIVRETLS